MEIITDFFKKKRQIQKPACVTVGTFDGVHLGHQQVIAATEKAATAIGGVSVVITFDPHPRTVLHKYEDPLLLTSTAHKMRLLEQMGIDYCIVIKFTRKFADISAREFIEKLGKRLDVRTLIQGHNNRLGRKEEGDSVQLKKLAKQHGFTLQTVNPIKVEGVTVSSTLIRDYIKAGELELAAECLGRKYLILGTVVSGDAVGRKLGYPTANIDPHNEVLPPSGVYAVRVLVNSSYYIGLLNIGYRPTIAGENNVTRAVEVHIIDFNDDIYGQDIEVIFEKKLREEKRFPDADSLIEQIQEDEKKVKIFFAQREYI